MFNKQLNFWFSIPVLVSLVFFGFIPVLVPIASQYEGKIFPVVRNVEITEIKLESENLESGIIIEIKFDKVRACEFVSIQWFDRFGHNVPILFNPDLDEIETKPVYTRPVMNGQRVGPWKLITLGKLEESMAILVNRCNPLWLTYTKFYP